MIRSAGPCPYRVLFFGGGPAVGYGVLSHELALAGHLARGLTHVTGHGIDMDVLVQVDLTCRQMPALLAGVDLEQFDSVVLSVGTQDVLNFASRQTWSTAVKDLLDLMRSQCHRVLPVNVIAVPRISNVLQLNPLLARATDDRAAEFNGWLEAFCNARPELTFIPFDHDGETVPCRERALATYRQWADPMIDIIAPTLGLVGEHAHPDGHEQARQAAVDRLDLDAVPEKLFDAIAQTARRIFGTQGAGISLIDHDRQWFKSISGAGVPSMPRRYGLCQFAIQTNHGFIVEDASQDPRLADSYFVKTAKLRSYAGIPIRDPSGHMIGALCVYDNKPRQFTNQDLITLRSLAHLLEQELHANA